MVYSDGRRAGKRQSHPRPQIRHGVRAANARALRGAHWRLKTPGATLLEASLYHGSNKHYIRAATTVINYGDQRLIDHLLSGAASILEVAKALEPQLKLTEALKRATPEQRTKAARAFGHPEELWDQMVAPQISDKAVK
jgi:hypothetical protein